MQLSFILHRVMGIRLFREVIGQSHYLILKDLTSLRLNLL